MSLAIMILKDQKKRMKSATNKPFWEEMPLAEMSEAQWESLCDGCGLCCLVRFEDEDTGEILPTRVHCKLYDPTSCLCSDYENRKTYVPDCVKLTPGAIENLLWMPKSCAYRRLHEGRGLMDWHYLVCGDRNRVHEIGVSIKGTTICESSLNDIEDALDYLDEDLQRDRSLG